MTTAWKILNGDAEQMLEAMAPSSLDAMVTDPPAGISFMGAAWDSDKGGVDEWTEWLAGVFVQARRVLKPGAHALVWAIPRTSHWTARSLELAGFEIRDVITHHYGSGFPKSLDVAKAMDRRRFDLEQVYTVTKWIRETRDAAGISNAAIDYAFEFRGMAGHWTSSKSQPAVPTLEQVPRLLQVLAVAESDVPPEIAELLVTLNTRKGEPGEAFHQREVVATKTGVDTRVQKIAASTASQGLEGSTRHEFDVTTAATEESQQWQGWGTALKPASEHWILARVPFRGTVAANVLEHATGALNIDANRTGNAGGCRSETAYEGGASKNAFGKGLNDQRSPAVHDLGRWPTNLLFTHSAECGPAEEAAGPGDCVEGCPVKELIGQATDAAEFFPTFRYTAKPSTVERDNGLDARNHHPTVKPIALMRWLCRLITPPGGTVLDPFCGSGTTLVAALQDGFQAVGIEREADFAALAKRRVEEDMPLFNRVETA